MHRWLLQVAHCATHSASDRSCVTTWIHMAGKRKPLPPVVDQLQVFVEQRRACEDTRAVHVVVLGCFMNNVSFTQTHSLSQLDVTAEWELNSKQMKPGFYCSFCSAQGGQAWTSRLHKSWMAF